MANHKRDRVPPMLAGAVDLGAAGGRPQAVPTMEFRVHLNFSLACYNDVNDAIPFMGIIDTSNNNAGPPAVAFTDTEGVMRFYTLAPNAVETLRSFLDIDGVSEASGKAAGLLRDALDDPEGMDSPGLRSKLYDALLLLTDGVTATEDETQHDDPTS